MTTQLDRPPVIAPGYNYRSVAEKISAIVLGGVPRHWYFGFAVSFLGFMLFLFAVSVLLVQGVGVWGVDIPVAWGFAIVNFVWWVGIGHAGTLISAILLLLRQTWRTSINRFAEAMTLFAVACAATYPVLHLGRPYFAYWLAPYPNTMGLWPQFRSPLVWDFFAITTYGTISLLFWYIGLIPDMATLRDRAKRKLAQVIFGFLSMGWRGSAKHWRRYEQTYYLMAAIATPLVVSVHTVVSFDFAVAIVPGWHSTIFPPYFVAGAIFSGFAMVLTLAIPLRFFYGLKDFITMRHLQNMALVMLVAGMIVGYGYMMEAFTAWYSGNLYEMYVQSNRALGPYAPFYWLMLTCNVLIPQLIWFRPIRNSTIALWVISLIVNVGMWLERFVIVVTSLHRDFVPSAWGYYAPTVWDIATFVGTIGLFFMLLFLFIRFLPVISIFEMRELLTRPDVKEQRA